MESLFTEKAVSVNNERRYSRRRKQQKVDQITAMGNNMTNDYLSIASEIMELENLLADIPEGNIIERMSLEARLESAKAALAGLPRPDEPQAGQDTHIMTDDIQKLLDDYTRWLRDKTVLREVDSEWVQVTTPYLDRHNDYLQFYVRREGRGYLLTDDGYIINDLVSSGCPLDSPKRQDLLRRTLAGFGVQTDGEQLLMKATPENFSLKQHNFIQAMLAVNDMIYLALFTDEEDGG